LSNSFETCRARIYGINVNPWIYGINVNPWIYEALMDRSAPFNDDANTVLDNLLPRARPLHVAETEMFAALRE